MAVTPTIAVLGQRSACAVRATRLDATCAPVPGDNNTVIAGAITTATATPDVEEGQRIEPRDACGNISWTSTDPDITKRYTLAIEFNTWDIALAEILTDSRVVIGATGGPWENSIAGIERPGSQTAQGNGAALEIWSRSAIGDGSCGALDDVPPYWRHVFPRVYLRLDDATFANDVITMKLSGWGASNSQWGDGPYGDWEMETDMGADTPFGSYFASTIPTIGAGGYSTTPAS